MEKRKFIEVAPKYYAIAIIRCLDSGNQKPVTELGIRIFHSEEFEDEHDAGHCYVDNKLIFRAAIKWLEERGLVETLRDEFGPDSYIVKQYVILDLIEIQKTDILFRKFYDGELHALHLALEKVNETYKQLGISEQDFETPDRDWEPLPLERDVPELQKVIEAIDETIEAIRSDNGYNATLPEERDFFLNGLREASQKLKDATTISIAYFDVFVLPTLEKVASRFREAATGFLANTAKQAVVEYIAYLRKKYLGF